jgi:hypothetical protein
VTRTTQLRETITGLIAFVASEEEIVLRAAENDRAGEGTAAAWAAAPLVAHNTEFKKQQVHRLESIGASVTPVKFHEIDHHDIRVYEHYATYGVEEVRLEHRVVTQRLIDLVFELGDDDLLDPSRHEWLGGRKLWLQIVVRGFWHPAGHIGEYYLTHDQSDRAIYLARHALVKTQHLQAPDAVVAMAAYNLACIYARSRLLDEAVLAITLAVEKNPEFRDKFRHEQDVESLRESGQLSELLNAAPKTS